MTDEVTGSASGERQSANDQLSDEYREAVGAVMAARRLYDQACTDHGEESWAATQAGEYLAREVTHRDQLRERYDSVLDQPAGRR